MTSGYITLPGRIGVPTPKAYRRGRRRRRRRRKKRKNKKRRIRRGSHNGIIRHDRKHSLFF
jgi:hypothetical protein